MIEKEEIFQELWSETYSAQISQTRQTQEDWEKIVKRIKFSAPKKSYFFLQSWRQCAVVLLLMLISSFVTYKTVINDRNMEVTEWQEFQVPYGDSQSIRLADGTLISLDAGSLLIYPKEFVGKSRSVFLTGEATFTVAHDEDKSFYVNTKHLNVEALGTVFTVKSYPNDFFTSTTLEKGSVRIGINSGSFEKPILKPGEQLVYSHLDHTVQVRRVDMNLYKMERKGYLIFKDIPFSELVAVLERKYNVTINYDSQRYENHKCNLKFAPDETVQDVMKVIQKLIHIQYKIEGNIIYIN